MNIIPTLRQALSGTLRLSHRQKTLTALLLIAICLGLLHRKVIRGDATFPYDFGGFHYPVLYYFFDHLRQGDFPLWNTSSYSGMPFVNNPNAALYYFPHWIFFGILILLGQDFTLYPMQYLNVVHYLLGATGFFFLLRDLGFAVRFACLGSLLFACNGFFLAQAQHLGVVETVAWIPIGLLLLRRVLIRGEWSYLVLLVIVIASMFFVGFMPEFLSFLTVACCYASYLLWVHPESRPKKVMALAAAGAVVFLLTAVQWAPILEYLGFSQKLGAHSGVPPQHSITFLIPNFLGSFKRETFFGGADPTTSYFYSGIVVPLLLPLGFYRKDRWLTFFKVLFVCAVLLTFMPMSQWVAGPLQLIPGIGPLFRPLNFTIYWIMAAIILSLKAFDGLTDLRYLKWAAIFLFAGSIGVYGMPFPDGPNCVRGALTRSFVLLLVVYLVAVFAKKQAKLLLSTIFFLELFLANQGLFFYAFPFEGNFLDPSNFKHPSPALIHFLRSDKDVFRVSVDQETAGAQWNGGPYIWSIESINGFDPLVNRRYLEMLERDGLTWRDERTFHLGDLRSESLKYLNVKYYVTQRSLLPEEDNFHLVFDGPLKVYEYDQFTPRYLLLPPSSLKQLDGGMRHVTAGSLTDDSVPLQIRSYSADVRLLEVNVLEEEAVVFLGEIYYPGWRLKVDGKPADIFQLNDVFIGAFLPRGHHRLELSFQPRSFRYGAWISAFGAVILMGFSYLSVSFRNQRQPAPSSG